MGRAGSRRRRDTVSGLRRRPRDSRRGNSRLRTQLKEDKRTRGRGDKGIREQGKGGTKNLLISSFPLPLSSYLLVPLPLVPLPLVPLSPCLPLFLFFTSNKSNSSQPSVN